MYIVITSLHAISIHSLRVEGDQIPPARFGRRQKFNPLPPCGGRLDTANYLNPMAAISIHSLRVEGDAVLNPSGWHL